MEPDRNPKNLLPGRVGFVPPRIIANNYNTHSGNINIAKNIRTYSGFRNRPPDTRHEPRPGTSTGSRLGSIPQSQSQTPKQTQQHPRSGPSNTSNQSEMILSTRDPLEELPPDLSYSEWFYYNIRSLKSKSASTPMDSSQLVEPYFQKPVNETIDPTNKKLLTQELDSNQIMSVERLSRYKLIIDRTELDKISLPDNTVPSTSNSDVATNERQTGNKKRLTRGNRKEPCQLLLSIQPQIAIIDRRPMLKRQELILARSTQTGDMMPTLISPEEDCDDDSDYEEIIEIDCD